MDGRMSQRLLAYSARPRPSTIPSLTLVVCALAVVACHSPAFAFEFVLQGGGTDQRLNGYWQMGYPINACDNVPGQQCDDRASVGGVVANSVNRSIPFTNQTITMTNGGSLTWTGADSLKVIARTAVQTRAFAGFVDGSQGYSESWTALNARDFPMVFQMLSEPGDPPSIPLRITPRLVGSFTHTTTVGGYTYVFVQMQMTVSVNGVPVTTDALNTEWEYAEGASATRVMDFPRAAANTIVIPDVPANSQISVKIWAYARAYSSMNGLATQNGQLTSTSPYGIGPAIVVLAEPLLEVTAVADESPGEALGLWARPNPSPGSTHIQYALPRSGQVTIALYDVAGHRVTTLLDRVEGAGRHQHDWSGRDAQGAALAPGIYFLELLADRERRVEKLVLLR